MSIQNTGVNNLDETTFLLPLPAEGDLIAERFRLITLMYRTESSILFEGVDETSDTSVYLMITNQPELISRLKAFGQVQDVCKKVQNVTR